MENILSDDLNHIIQKTGDLWEELREKKIFITGGTGFFGCWLLESFIWANNKYHLNAEAWVLSRNPKLFKKKYPQLALNSNIKLLIGNVLDFSLPAEEFSHIIHASVYTDSQIDGINKEKKMMEVVLEGLWHTLEVSIKHGVKKFLLASTGAVYGSPPQEKIHIKESYLGKCDPTDIRNAYKEVRRMAEMMCTIYSKRYGFESKIARGFAFIGPYLPLTGQFAAGNFINDGLIGKKIYVKSDGKPYRSYLYASDMVTWLWTILIRGCSCIPYNVGSEDAITIADLAHLIAKKFKPSPEVIINTDIEHDTTMEFYVPDTSRARTELGLQQTVTLNDGIEKMLLWYKNMGENKMREI